MRRRTAAGFNGPNPIAIEAIDAFLRCSGLRLAPWEFELIEEIDDLFLASVTNKGDAPDPRVSSRPARDVFDAIWG
ncbi:hypothetical protein MIC97_05645 [Aquamicrobium sp. NLF2-7]|uniref:hypothetical protein n=1 Tax=Aquamicrobium sp. NLF2-7 TaxID=2918753 RepID=UPI001EFB202B|nr:hypothetical protein [Aquamicrobium sp. NLF2-7]MCG8270991.1 hypothetical protein [Aquamicrobium sp. NLF2-7]